MPDYDLVVIGSGYAGSTAALSFLESTEQAGRACRVALIEARKKGTWPGASRWTKPFLRLKDDDTLAPDRAEQDSESDYWRRLKEEVADAVEFMLNAACGEGEWNPAEMDGKKTSGITPPKSNWANLIVEAPFYGFPMTANVKFTFGGLRIDADGRVLNEEGAPIPSLYAAGEITGHFHHKHPASTSVLRANAFGRVVGTNVAKSIPDTAATTG